MDSVLSKGDYVIANTFANGKFVGQITRVKEGFAPNKPVFVVADLVSDFEGSVASGYCTPVTKESIEVLEREEKAAIDLKWSRIKAQVLT